MTIITNRRSNDNTLILLLFLIALTYSSKIHAQITFDMNFENGRLDTSYVDSGSYALSPITNLHFRLLDASNKTPVFKIHDSLGYQLRPYHHMVYRYEGDTNWHHFDTAYKNTSIDFYYFKNQTPFTQDTVYVAYWYPYTVSDLEEYLINISGNPYLINSNIKTTTIGGRNIYGYEVTDTNYSECYKKNVVVTVRQHPIENINGYFVEGLTDYLLNSQDSIAFFLRRNYHFFIYPMLNPDGVFIGSGQNLLGQGLNREWEDSLTLSGTPEIDSIRPVIWMETNQKIDWSIDIHGNAGSNIPYYWWGYTNTSGLPQWQIDDALDYVQSVSGYDTSSTINTSSFQNYIQGNGVSNSKTAANWFRKTFNSIAFTFEPTSEPMGVTGDNKYTIAQLREGGQSLAMGFFDVHDTVQSLGGEINVLNNMLYVQISGGHPPYMYSWTGPVTGNSDTLFTSTSGIYTAVVTDSIGCIWTQSITYGMTSIPTVNEVNFNFYPNPAKDYVNITFNSSLSTPVIIELFDFLGIRRVRQVGNSLEINRIELNPSLNGIYILKIQIGHECYTSKLLIID